MNNQSPKSIARTAGMLYLLLAFSGIFGILYVPSQTIVSGDALATMESIRANEFLFRLGILSQLICQILFVYLVLNLNRLLRPVNESLARQMVTLVVVSIPITFLNLLNLVAALVLINNDVFQSSFGTEQTSMLIMFFYKLYNQGVNIVQIFWGLWLIPFGQLVYRSKFIPALFGILLVLGGIGYVVASVGALLFPSHAGIIGDIATIPSAIGEFAIVFWLLIKGVKEQP